MKTFTFILNDSQRMTLNENSTYEDFDNYVVNHFPTYFDFRFVNPKVDYMKQKITKHTWPAIKDMMLLFNSAKLVYLDRAQSTELSEELPISVEFGEETFNGLILTNLNFKQLTKQVKELSKIKQHFIIYQLDTGNFLLNKIEDDKTLKSALKIAGNKELKLRLYFTMQDPFSTSSNK